MGFPPGDSPTLENKFRKKSKESRPVLRFGKTRMESPWNLSRSEEGEKWLGLFSPLLLLLHEMTRCEIYDSKRWRRKRRRRRRREVRQLLRLPSSFLREAALSGKYPPHKGDGEKSPPPPPPLHPPHFFPFLTARHKREREREP